MQDKLKPLTWHIGRLLSLVHPDGRKDLQILIDNRQALVIALEEVLSRNAELLEVATLRGDNDLPHPSQDPILWTARMQDAWGGLDESIGIIEAALASVEGV